MNKSVDYYLSKGFSISMAEYYVNGRKTLTGVEPLDEHTLLLIYNGCEKRILDVSDIIKPGTVFAFLCNKDDFYRVYVDDTHSVYWDIDPNVDSNEVWSNKVDLSPDTCYVDSIPADL